MKDKWYFDPQRIFKEWKKKEGKNSDSVKQTITRDAYEEEVHLWSDENRLPVPYTLYAYRMTEEVYLLPLYGEPIRIVLRKHKGF